MSYNKASIVLIPSGYKEGQAFSQKPVNGDGDFGVASSATTRVNADGLIEKETQNLLLQSNSFDTSWINSGTISKTSGQSGYDGSSDAWLLTKSSASAYIYQNVSSGLNTISIYAKSGSLNWLYILKGGNTGQYYNLSTGVLGSSNGPSPIDANIEDVGGGWYRCSLTYTDAFSGSLRFYPADGNLDVSGTSGNIYIQDAQLEQGLAARDYLETTDSAVYSGMTDNVPQLDYLDSSCPAYLFEPQRSNLIPYSEALLEYNQFKVIVSEATKSYTTGLNLEGYNSAIATMLETATTGNHRVYFEDITPCTIGTSYALTLYIRSVGGRNVRISDGGKGMLIDSEINLSNGTKITDVYSNCVVKSLSNDVYQISFFGVNNSIHSSQRCFIQSLDNTSRVFLGDVTKGLEFLSAQYEEGYYPTSLIPTYGTATTRIGNYFNDKVSALYDISNNFSFVIHWRDTKPATSSQNLFSVFTNSPNDFYIYLNASRVNIYIQNGGGYVFGSGANGSWTSPTTKIAITWNNRTKELKYFINGSLFDSGIFPDHNYGTTTTVQPTFAGSNGKSSLEKFLFYKEALSDQECIDITT